MSSLTFNDAQGYSLTLPLEQGMIGVFGVNGSGKTHLLQSFAGIRKAANTVYWQGKCIMANARDNPCAYHAQQAQLLGHLNVKDNLDLVYAHSTWASNRTLSWQAVIDLCELAPNQGNSLLTRSVDSLSGGELQRVCLARTLMTGKPVLLLDEPFSALDPQTRQRLCNKLYQLQRDTTLTIILVSHHLPELLCYCDHIIHVVHQALPQLYDCDAFAQQHTVFNRIALGQATRPTIAQEQCESRPEYHFIRLGKQVLYASVALEQAAIVIAQDACMLSQSPIPSLAHQANVLQGYIAHIDDDCIKITINNFIMSVKCNAYSLQALNLLDIRKSYQQSNDDKQNESANIDYFQHRSTLYVYFPILSGITYT